MIRIPASSASRGPSNRTGRPSRRICPSYPAIAPARIFISVLLPAPFSPQRAWTSPAPGLEMHVLEGMHAAEVLGDVLQTQPHRGEGIGVR